MDCFFWGGGKWIGIPGLVNFFLICLKCSREKENRDLIVGGLPIFSHVNKA